MKEDLKNRVLIFTGSDMIAMGLSARLKEIGVVPILTNDTESALRNVFAITLNNQVHLFIKKDELEMSKDIIDTYLKEIEEN